MTSLGHLDNMDINLEKPFQSLFGQLLTFSISLLDDALLLLLSRLGLHINGLQWLSPVLMICTILYWAVQFWRNRCCDRKELGQSSVCHARSAAQVKQVGMGSRFFAPLCFAQNDK